MVVKSIFKKAWELLTPKEQKRVMEECDKCPKAQECVINV